jgi:hypothetical protein
MADFKTRLNVPVSGGVTGNRDLITSPNLFRWLMEGKIFEAGMGGESTAIASSDALLETEPQITLQAPKNDTLIIPIQLRLAVVADGGALTNWQVAFTKAAASCATSLTLSGTACHHISNCNTAFLTSPEATALYGDKITSSALVVGDYVSYHYGAAIDALLTTGLVTLGNGPSNVSTYNFLDDGAPHILANGAAMLVYTYTGTSDSTWTYYMQWAEVKAADLY